MKDKSVHPEVQKVVDMMGTVISSRHEAADLLRKVAEFGEAGCWPKEVTCEEVGLALYRIAENSQEKDPLLGLLKGWRVAELREYYQQVEQYLKILRQRETLMEELGRIKGMSGPALLKSLNLIE